MDVEFEPEDDEQQEEENNNTTSAIHDDFKREMKL